MNSGRQEVLAWMDRARMTPSQLAAELHISRPYMSQVLLGERRPSLEVLADIATLTGVPIISWVEIRMSKMAEVRKAPPISRCKPTANRTVQ